MRSISSLPPGARPAHSSLPARMSFRLLSIRSSSRMISTSSSPVPSTSEFVGNSLFQALNPKYNFKVKSYASTDLVPSPENFLSRTKPTLLVNFGRSGNSPSLWAMWRPLRSSARTCITCL